MVMSLSRPSRRRFLAGAGACAALYTLPPAARAATPAADGFRILRARPDGAARLRGPNEPPTPIWGYDGQSPGPTLRVRQGEPLKVRLINDLRQPTVIHWHGIRLQNAMDGVPHLTQMPIEPGESFDYVFTPPDAGTFWYHTHFLSSEQLARGLYGVLIVDEREPVQVDRDVALVIGDWRLANDGNIAGGFGNFHDAMMAGRLGQYITLNSQDTLDVPVTANERVRLRIINAANARIFQLRIARHSARVMAVDGQPCSPAIAPDGVLRLGPGSRVDLFLDATLEPGAKAPIMVDDLRGGEIELGRIVYSAAAPARAKPLEPPAALPANPLPDTIDRTNALVVDVPLEGGGMGMTMGGGMGGGRGGPMGMGRGMMGGGMGAAGFRGQGVPEGERIWALAGTASTGHDGPPMFTIKRGRTVVLNFANRTAFPHAMHVHGHHFRQRAGRGAGFTPYWLDTVIVDPERTEQVAFVADNPGKWMLHCHMIEHMAAGMAAWFEVA